jgi:phage terminase large subunit-like protein
VARIATSIKPKGLTVDEIAALEHIYYGPSWRKTEDGKWDLPEHTLGWQILGWCAEFLNNFDGTPNLRLTAEQARILLWWYAVDLRGRFIYRQGVIQRLKGHGKDPLLAVISLIEFVGPSRFAGWDKNGKPVGERHPNAWVQIAAVNQAQTRNTMTLMPSLMSQKLIDAHGIKDGAELIRAHNGKVRLEAVTSSFRALEGGRSTFVMLNETQHWVQGNNGLLMHKTVARNAAKTGSRFLAVTNAYLPGEDSVAERMREGFEKIRDGRMKDPGLMYDSIEANPLTPLTEEALRIVVPIIRGDSSWLKVEDVIASVLDPTQSASDSRRMWLNQIVADEDAIYGPEHWKPLEVEGAVLSPGDEIVLGFDGGKSDDATVLVALRVKDRVAFILCLEERPANWPTGEGAPRWEVNRETVDSAVHSAFNLYKVRGFYADVALWESYIDDWAEAYRESLVVKASERHAVAWDMRQSIQRLTRAHERLMQAIFDRKVFHDGDPDLRRHVLNARRRINNYGVSFGKESRESPKKVDAYAALMLAHEALHDLRTRGKPTKERTGRGYFL